MKLLKPLFNLLVISFCITPLATPLAAQNNSAAADTSSEETIRLFLDCRRCDRSFIRTNIQFVNYVRNQEDADVHLLINRARTGSGGTEYTLRLIGRKSFDGQDRRLTFNSVQSDTEDEERKGLVQYIKIGLLPYLADTPAMEKLNITYEAGENQSQISAGDDPWDYWVFELNGNMFLDGEESRKTVRLSGGASADRVTEEWKFQSFFNYNYNKRSFSETDSLGDTTTRSFITRGFFSRVELVKSLGDHWSAGITGHSFSSTRNNIDLGYSVKPAIEYNIFPYSDYSEKEISFIYGIGPSWYNYDEITIFNKRRELLVQQELQSRMEFVQPWGEIEGRLNASTYLHDLSKNQVRFNLELDIRIYRGLSVNLSGRYAIINDQLSIPAGDISDAEQLLNLRQQATSYSYGGSVGLEFSFGSIYNNIVNPRF